MITTRTAITRSRATLRTSSPLFPLFDALERRHKGRSLGVVEGPGHVPTSGGQAEKASASVGKVMLGEAARHPHILDFRQSVCD
jgi:hypothetical protein